MKLCPPIDPGLAFDMLSVLSVKRHRAAEIARPEADTNWHLFAASLSIQLGERLYGAIVSSPEYDALYRTNLELFLLIDTLERPDRPADECHDREVNNLNRARWRAKAALQARFFPDTPLSEQKLDAGQPATP